MDNLPHLSFKLQDRSYTSIIKREIKKLAELAGFSAYRLAELDLVVSEMITNLVKHTREGEILVKPIDFGENKKCIEIINIDNGPGMSNVNEMLMDGRSTSSSLGQGLGSIKRLSDEFDLYSLPNWGTILMSRMFNKKPLAREVRELLSFHTIIVPKPGEMECGDGWILLKKRSLIKLMALDGLGHGPEAAKAVKAAVKEFVMLDGLPPSESIKIMHKKIKGTRGAVGMVFHLDIMGNTISYAGLGNISARIIGLGKTRNCISYNGIIGHSIPNSITSNTIAWQPKDTLIINSDGVKTRWELGHLPGIFEKDGSILAAAIYKDFSRGNDDVLISVVKPSKK